MKKKIFAFAFLAGSVLLFTKCNPSEYLSVSSPAQSDNEFVTSTVDEARKAINYCYATYKSTVPGGNYNWNDPCSDAEYYPEIESGNGRIGYLQPTTATVDTRKSQFDQLYSVVARAKRIADIISEKSEYIAAKESGKANDWTQLYGECMTFWALGYFELVRHFGDVPFGIENSVVEDYTLTSRFEILDACIEALEEAEPLMYDLGSGINAERISRTFANLLIGEIALNAGGYQTIRTDVEGLYGDISFNTLLTEEGSKAAYARRSDYQRYYQTAQTYLRKVVSGERKGSSRLLTVDERSFADNPFQRGFQYLHDYEISPESIFEVGCIRGTGNSERPYAQGRPSGGSTNNGAPSKVFSGIRVIPTAYYQVWEDGDKRWDASAVVTGSDGLGNETMLSLLNGNMLNGGIAINKWDINKMSDPYLPASRNAGLNYVIRRVSNAMLLLAEADAVLGETTEALNLLNQLRDRAFGDSNHRLSGLSGDALIEAVTQEVKREFMGEGDIKWNEVRSGTFSAKAKAVRAEVKELRADLTSKGYHEFPNGRVMSNFIWTKLVQKENPLTYDRDESDPALTPGWRGVFDYSTTSVAGIVVGTAHNLAIQGLFEYIDPEGPVAKALEDDGYVKTAWGYNMVEMKVDDKSNNADAFWDYNILSGIELSAVPLYFHPIPLETILQSGGNVTNGYGLPQA